MELIILQISLKDFHQFLEGILKYHHEEPIFFNPILLKIPFSIEFLIYLTFPNPLNHLHHSVPAASYCEEDAPNLGHTPQ